jgi:sialate O-acetylesterase
MNSNFHKLWPFLGKRLLFLMLCFFIPQLMFGLVKLPKLVANGMILQRNTIVPVWGTAAAGETVTVNFKGQTFSTVTPASGKWKINIGPYAAGGPNTMVITGTNTTVPINLSDILIGDVYLCSGQSNMALQFNYTTASTLYAAEINNSANTNIRQFKVSISLSNTPQENIAATPYGNRPPKPP